MTIETASFNHPHMQYLERIYSTPKASAYAIKGDYNSNIERYIVSTPQSRSICNSPEILGCDYTNRMREATVAALESLPFIKHVIRPIPEESICILNFLRGGLNFDLRDALNLAFGINRHRTSFMTSQRYIQNGRWGVKENAYRKFNFPKDATIFIADVVATGVTMDSGLEVLIEHLKENRSSLKNLVFFTIGCHKVEKILHKYDAIIRNFSPNFGKIYVVYFEGKFKLVDSKTDLKIGIPGTDLVRFDALLSPEFGMSQYDELSYMLERCTIYDAGSRAFDTTEYLHDVINYWEKVQALATDGFTLRDAIAERLDDKGLQEKDALIAQKKQIWLGLDEDFWDSYYAAHFNLWTNILQGPNGSSAALFQLCTKRLECLKELNH